MHNRILNFRRVKHGEPDKMKVLAEDLPRSGWLDRLTGLQFAVLTGAASIVVVAGVMLIST